MSDLISRNALLEEFKKCHISFNGTPMEESDMMISYRSLARVINKQQTVEAKSVVHGEWIESKGVNYWFAHTCSICGEFEDFEYNFCPNCGCDMRGGKND